METHVGDRNHSHLPVARTPGSRSLMFPPSLQLYEDPCSSKGTHNRHPFRPSEGVVAPTGVAAGTGHPGLSLSAPALSYQPHQACAGRPEVAER